MWQATRHSIGGTDCCHKAQSRPWRICKVAWARKLEATEAFVCCRRRSPCPAQQAQRAAARLRDVQAHAAKASEVQAPKRPASPPEGATIEPRPLDVNKAKQLQASGAEVAVMIQAVNKGGVTFEYKGMRCFIPYSRLDPSRLPPKHDFGSDDLSDMQPLIGQKLSARVIQVDTQAVGGVIMSERAALTAQLARSLKEGDVVEGVVIRLADYGAFVSLRSADGELHGAEGMIHLSELSWDWILKPEAVVQVGTVVRCKVLRTAPEKAKISLSLKRMEEDPLLETLDGVLPQDARTKVMHVPANIPSSIEDICAALDREPKIRSITLGRQVEEKRAVSQDLELWISRQLIEDGFTLVARAGKLVQEIHIATDLSAQEVKNLAQSVLRSIV